MPTRKITPNIDQGSLFTGFQEPKPESLADLVKDVAPTVPYREKSRLTQTYLLTLNRFNERLRTEGMERIDLSYDNLFLRNIFGGIQNSLGMPAELLKWLNWSEILIMEAGIYKRKFIGDQEVAVNALDAQGHYQEPRKVALDPSRQELSRIEREGQLDGKSLFYVMNHLLKQHSLAPIYNEHKRFWKQNAGRNDTPQIRQFFRMNPYDPESLQERMDYAESAMPHVFEQFKDVLRQPFIPEREVEHMGHGNFRIKKHPDGFKTPGRTYRKGVKGKSFYRLDEYAGQVARYFEMKRNQLLSKSK